MNTRIALLPLGLLVAACATAAPPEAAASSPPPTSTLTASPAPTPTDTGGVTPPLPTPSPTAPPTATPRPSPSPTPAVINPLTGLALPDPAAIDRRPLAIKIAHFPRSVRPQFGLSLADNVWEHYTEGGVTRFTAIFLSQNVGKVGNVRSARLIDALLGEAYQAMLVASGSSPGTLKRLAETDFYDRVIAEATGYDRCPPLCREASAEVTTDKLYTDTQALWQLADELGLNGRQTLEGFVFSAEPPGDAVSAETIRIDFQADNTVVEWRFDPQTQSYARWVDTADLPELAPHTDAVNGQQIAAANVVVIYASHTPSNVREDEHGLHYAYETELTGQGPARLFRNGLAYEVMWTRAAGELPRFADVAGLPVPFLPGNIWFEVIAQDSPTTFADGRFAARFKAPAPPPVAPEPTETPTDAP